MPFFVFRSFFLVLLISEIFLVACFCKAHSKKKQSCSPPSAANSEDYFISYLTKRVNGQRSRKILHPKARAKQRNEESAREKALQNLRRRRRSTHPKNKTKLSFSLLGSAANGREDSEGSTTQSRRRRGRLIALLFLLLLPLSHADTRAHTTHARPS